MKTGCANASHEELVERAQSLGKVALLYGGASTERDVSLMSLQALTDIFQSLRIDFIAIDTARANTLRLLSSGIDRVFISILGRGGEDGTLQGMLDFIGLPYTGSGVLGSALAWDKWASKMMWSAYGLPVLPAQKMTVGDMQQLDTAGAEKIAQELGFPLFIKPLHEGSTLGGNYADNTEQFLSACRTAVRYDKDFLIEKYVAGMEITFGFLIDEVLPSVHIEKSGRLYDFYEKYFGTQTKYYCPAHLDDALAQRLQELTVQSINVLQCRGWGRIDMLMDAQNNAYLLEMNTSPGITAHSLYPMALAAAGISWEEFVVRLLESARVG